jgi:hypothetical protein
MPIHFFLFFLLTVLVSHAAPVIQVEQLGKAMGGWTDKGGKAARFEVSGSLYRSWKPEVSPTPTGGIFVSVRLDHLRGLLASDDHASLEVTFDAEGNVVSARSSIALQGRRVTSDLIEGTGRLGARLVGMDLAAKVGTEMVSNLSSKIFKEKIREPGRVSFPAVLQHQYNLLCLALETEQAEDEEEGEGEDGGHSDGKERTAVPLTIEAPKK